MRGLRASVPFGLERGALLAAPEPGLDRGEAVDVHATWPPTWVARHMDPLGHPHYTSGVRALTTDFADAEARPYFFWDEDVSVRELREVLAGPDSHQRDRLLAKMLREARDTDVWTFVTPREVARRLPELGRRLGKRQAFWAWLIEGWREDGIL